MFSVDGLFCRNLLPTSQIFYVFFKTLYAIKAWKWPRCFFYIFWLNFLGPVESLKAQVTHQIFGSFLVHKIVKVVVNSHCFEIFFVIGPLLNCLKVQYSLVLKKLSH